MSQKNLSDYLFDALERLNDPTLKAEDVEKEVQKAQAITKISDTILRGAEISLKTEELRMEYGSNKVDRLLQAKPLQRLGMGVKNAN
ncbi:hypothetical protein DPW02_11935 [Aggregatibacter aphrophilus]|jgi:hypothetical protein|nr:hypothetical protein DPW02_11935 [Aggregatibacter aphrophilus]